ncbi:PAS domain S-box protein [Halorussus halophilus]|uniref:PAS domain S-box protein n=1 Tax=Halorussus halophilus TaxID=2650975 RepID=UPI0013018DDD|nr:PAS domain S-box protein [Halorussus halophilus]
MRGHDEQPADESAGQTAPTAPDSGGFFEGLITSASEAVLTTAADGSVVYANAAAESLFGYDANDLHGRPFTDLVPERRRERFQNGLHDSDPETGDLVLTGLAADGDELPLSATVFEHGEYVTGFVREAEQSGEAEPTALDATDSSQEDTEESNEESHPLVDDLLEASPVALSIRDADNENIRANDRAVELLGVGHEGLNTDPDDDPFTVFDADGEPLPEEEYPVFRAFETGEPVHNEEVLIERPDGEEIWLSLSATPVYDGDTISHVVTAGEEITDLKRAQQKLERQRAELETELAEVFERVADGFFALNADWEFTYVNDAAREMIARSDDSLVGKNLWEEFPEALGTNFEREYERAMETQQPVSFEGVFDPLDVWFEVRAYPSETGLSVYFGDITDRKERERELERYETIVETIEDGIYTVSPDETLSMTNSAYAAMTGYDADELVGFPTSEIVAEDEDVHDEIPALEEEIADGKRKSATVEAQLRTKDGETFPVEATFVVREVEDGHERIGVVRDITDRKRRERELERYETIVETIDDGIYTVNEDGEFTMVNNAYAAMTGYDTDELVGSVAGNLVDGAVASEVSDLEAEMVADERPSATVEATVERKDGETFPAEGTFVVNRTDDGYERIGVVRDVTDRKSRQQQLEQYERVVETVTDGVYILDEDGQFVLFNEAFVSMTRHCSEELLGAHASMVFGEKFDQLNEEMSRKLAAGELDTASVEEDIYTADGETITVENRFKHFDFADSRRGRVGVVRDITDRKERERKLREQNERLDAFASMLAHELRNPLEIAQIYLNMAFDGDESALEQVDSALDRIEEMIDALLVVTRRGDSIEEPEPIDLNDVVGNWWDDDGTLVLETERKILADENRLRQLLKNLFRNANEHAGEDPTVRVGDLPDGFFVADDGPGIPDGKRDDVFEPGYSTSSVGIGFGLSVVNHLAEAHGWTVEVTTSDEGGARFEFTGVEVVEE